MNKKMVNTANGLYKFFKVLDKLLIAAGIVIIVIGILLPFFSKNMIAPAGSVSFGAIELVLTNTIAPEELAKNVFMFEGILVGGLGLLTVCLLAVRTLCDIIAPMQDGKPFEIGMSKKIQKLGILTLVFGALSQIIEYAITTATFFAYDIASLVDSTQVSHVNLDYHFDVKFVLVAFVIFLLSYVFKYGEELQREADETL